MAQLVARLFRKKQIDISTAHVIEAFRLAETLTSLRGLSRIGLLELNEVNPNSHVYGRYSFIEFDQR